MFGFDFLLLVEETFPWDLQFSGIVAINVFVYCLFGSLIALLFCRLKGKMKFEASKGVLFVGFTLAIIPLLNVLGTLYPQVSFLKMGILMPNFPVPNLYKVAEYYLNGHPVVDAVSRACVFIEQNGLLIETFLFIGLVMGILSLRKWSYHLLMLVIAYSIFNAIFFLVSHPGQFLFQTIITQ